MMYDPASFEADIASDPRPALPLDFHAQGLNTLLSRTGWGSDASWFSYSQSWNQIDHQQANAGNFEWYRNGEWLTKARNGYPDIAEGIASSEFRNLMALENDRPSRDSTDWRTDLWQRGSQWNLVNDGTPPLLASSSNRHYMYAQGDLTPMYNSTSENTRDIAHASRSIVWLKPDTVVVLDRAESRTANRFKRWWLQLANPAQVSSDGRRASSTTPGGQQLQVASLLPQGARFLPVNSSEAHIEQTAARNEVMRVRLRLDAPDNPARTRFLNVLQAGNSGSSPLNAVLVQTTDSAFHGAQIGDTVVMFPDTPSMAVTRLNYPLASTARNHIITGLAPNAIYDISSTDSSLNLVAANAGSHRADSGGVLHVASGAPRDQDLLRQPGQLQHCCQRQWLCGARQCRQWRHGRCRQPDPAAIWRPVAGA